GFALAATSVRGLQTKTAPDVLRACTVTIRAGFITSTTVNVKPTVRAFVRETRGIGRIGEGWEPSTSGSPLSDDHEEPAPSLLLRQRQPGDRLARGVEGTGSDEDQALRIEVLAGRRLHILRRHGGDRFAVVVQVVEAEMVTLDCQQLR